jgi:aspartate kinase
MRVLKFGGVALRDGASIKRAVAIVEQYGGPRPLVVVSAHAGVTGHLNQALRAGEEVRSHWNAIRVRHRTLLHQLELPAEMLDSHLRELLAILEGLSSNELPRRRMRDHVLSFGERMSARVFAAALNAKGLGAVPMDAFDLGMVSEGGRLCSPQAASQRVRNAIDGLPGVPVITGFLALDGEGYLTTLGSSGSDLTAAWFGATLGAESIDLWKRVSGLLRADPRLIPGAEHLNRLDWNESEELARHGAMALHAGAVDPARGAGIPIRLRCIDDPEGPGTVISERSARADIKSPLALAQRTGLVHVRVPFRPGRAHGAQLAEFFGNLTEQGLEPYLGVLGEADLQVLVAAGEEVERLEAGLPEGSEVQTGLGTIALVGRALAQDKTLAGTLAECAEIGALEIHSWAGAEMKPPASGELGSIESRVLLLPELELPAMLAFLYERFFGAVDLEKPVH